MVHDRPAHPASDVPRTARRRLLAGLGAAAALGGGWVGAGAAPAPSAPGGFAFALIGDVPYGTREVPQVDALIRALNADAELAFVLHVGDIKSGAERCDDGLLRERLRQMQQVRAPLVYTPGDNEWTDCHRPLNGGYVPTERLALLRRLFFAEPGRSLGRQPMAVRSQALEDPAHAAFVENVMFERQRVLFATLHVVGSRNDLLPWVGVDYRDNVSGTNAQRGTEFETRQAANLAWLDRLFGEAQRRGAAAVVVAMHANLRIEMQAGIPKRQGFDAVVERLRTRAAAFGRPVLLLHGDYHGFHMDQPWNREGAAEPRLPNVTRVQSYGSPHVHWVKVRVAPGAQQVFDVVPRRVKGNP
ncbi:hypothetical protein [Azohydromonas australica]|uniref:hypothetical protein n=1 Tax=Azohydromonas australica TaxID=364039 RepID=UPI000687824D|nr:hypothetical protein [Azohydromonas australica]